MGVLIHTLCGNESTVTAIMVSLGKRIRCAKLVDDDELRFDFDDDTYLRLWDAGQSCCEHRYMSTNDDLAAFAGATLLDFELKSAPDQQDRHGDCHEVQFLDVKTSLGVIQMASHNEHNGYYGGFSIVASTSGGKTE